MTENLLPVLLDIKATVAATEARLTSLEGHITQRMDNQDKRANGHGDRLRSLERTSWYRGGAIAMIAAAATAAAAKFGVHL